MADVYSNYKHLSSLETEGTDFEINVRPISGARFCIVSPHGGGIEPETTRLTEEIAGSDYSYYSFMGLLSKGNRRLHITSHKFDEPGALELVIEHDLVLGIHGAKDSNCEKPILLGGLDEAFKGFLAKTLTSKGFVSLSAGHAYLALRLKNICNRGRTGKGAQIELSKSLREELKNDAVLRSKFVGAIREAISLRAESLE